MKISKEFALREIAGNYIVIPFGEKTVNFKSMITLNETGAFLWKQLEEEKTFNELQDAMLEEYDVDSETANLDIGKFVEKLKSAGILQL
ncbi:PqqD family protein [Acetivibrio cellulolyticus]|uniref:PqqD family protein n=1 Tax=Acetivibrio cellulolyticus TaxID=35830 RepID=UPI0001E2D4F9|nr:PqqD family protein [Acetivibrio cellulolyticus]